MTLENIRWYQISNMKQNIIVKFRCFTKSLLMRLHQVRMQTVVAEPGRLPAALMGTGHRWPCWFGRSVSWAGESSCIDCHSRCIWPSRIIPMSLETRGSARAAWSLRGLWRELAVLLLWQPSKLQNTRFPGICKHQIGLRMYIVILGHSFSNIRYFIIIHSVTGEKWRMNNVTI